MLIFSVASFENAGLGAMLRNEDAEVFGSTLNESVVFKHNAVGFFKHQHINLGEKVNFRDLGIFQSNFTFTFLQMDAVAELNNCVWFFAVVDFMLNFFHLPEHQAGKENCQGKSNNETGRRQNGNYVILGNNTRNGQQRKDDNQNPKLLLKAFCQNFFCINFQKFSGGLIAVFKNQVFNKF